jgi:ABC-type transporter Mla subunit MlaD
MDEQPPVDPLDQPISRRVAKRSLLLCGAVVGIVLAALIAVAGYQFVTQRTFSRETRAALVRTQAALCTFRQDLQDRVDSSHEFLVTHPHGIKGLATAKQIQDDIANRQRTIQSLAGLSCPPPLPAPKGTP